MPVCCVFRPAFGCCAHEKAGQNLFFSRFSTFFVHFKAFSRQIWGTPSGSQPAFACRPALRSWQNHVFFRSFLDIFCWFQLWNSEFPKCGNIFSSIYQKSSFNLCLLWTTINNLCSLFIFIINRKYFNVTHLHLLLHQDVQ